MKEEFENQENLNENEVSAENINEVESQGENNKKPKKKKKIVLGIILGIIAALIVLFMATPYKLLFSNKKMTLLTYLSKDITSITDLTKKVVKNDIFNFLKNDTTKTIDFDVNFNGKKLTGNTALDKEFFALKLNEVNSNYYLLNNDKLDELLEKFEITDYEMPSEIDFGDMVTLSNGEIRKIKNFILNSCYDVLENISDENITIQANKVLTINSNPQEFQTVELKMSQSEFLEVQKIILERIKKDGVLDIYIEKMGEFIDIDEAEVEKSYEEYIEYIDNYVEYIKSYHNLNNIEEENFMVYRIYFDDKNVVARELTEKYTYNDTVYEDVIMSFITTDEYYELKTFTQIEQSAAYYTTISDVVTKENNSQKYKITYIVDGFSVDSTEGTYEFAYTPIHSEEVYNIVIENLNDYTQISISDINNIYKLIINYNKDNIKMEFNNNFENILKIKLDAKEDETITKESLINNGAIELNTKTKEELTNEFNNIAQKLSELL